MGGGSGPTTQARFIPFQFTQDGVDQPFVTINSTFILDDNEPLHSIVSSNGKAILTIGDATDEVNKIVVHNIVNPDWTAGKIMSISASDIVNNDKGWSFSSTADQTITINGVSQTLINGRRYYVGYSATYVSTPVVVESATSGRDQPATLYTAATTISYDSAPEKSSVWPSTNYVAGDEAIIDAGINESDQIVDATSYNQSGLTAGNTLNPSTSISTTVDTNGEPSTEIPNGTPVTSTFTYTDPDGKDWNTTVRITTAANQEINTRTTLAAVTNGDGIESAMFVTEASASVFGGDDNFRILSIGGLGVSYEKAAVEYSTDTVNYEADGFTVGVDVGF